MRIKIDWSAVRTAIRTAGALMTGNAFVGYFVLGQTNFIKFGLLFAAGITAIIALSIEKGTK